MPTIAERYTLADRLGSGAMGDVYRATDTQTGDTVAVKALKPDLVRANPDLLTRFQREGEALRELNHPNIVSLLDVASEDDGHYLVMEYISGGDLAGLLSDAPRGLPIEQVLNIALDLADALTRAHRLDIIHRDLKPANILIAEDGTPRLSDFGIARFSDKDALTTDNQLLGTIPYMSPQIIMGEAIDYRDDIWSFGVVVYEMLVGDRPFRGDTLPALMTAILHEPLSDKIELRSDIPGDLVDLIYRMLSKDRAGRIPSVRLVGAEIEGLVKGFNIRETRRDQTSTGSPLSTRYDVESLFDTPAVDPAGARHNLPYQTTPFVGRETELAELKRVIADPTIRLITILGPGGMGKTRLSIEAGLNDIDRFKDGVFFVELAPLSDADAIPAAIGQAANYRFIGDTPPHEQIISFLTNKDMLLILDNFEHIMVGTGLVTDILEAAPDLTILATSRERLHLSGETVFTLGGMAFPEWETPSDALNYAAVQLFMESARRARVDFELAPGDLGYLARICRLVEGVPLGILLAAGWVDTLPLAEIADEVANSIDFLEQSLSDLPPRQRSIRAAYDYSWNLLSEDERDAFSRLAVFRSSCTHRAASQVTGASLRMLTRLADKSLLGRNPESGRFEIHELLRQLAEEQLTASGQADAIRQAHAEYYLTALAAIEDDIKGRDQLRALNDIEVDFENVRVAWLWAVENVDLPLLAGALTTLALFCKMRSRFNDANDLLYTGLSMLEKMSAQEARALWGRMRVQRETINVWGRDLGMFQEDFELALQVAQEAGDQAGEGLAQYALGWLAISQSRFGDAASHFEASVDIFEGLHDRFFQADALHYLAYSQHFGGNAEGGYRLSQRTVALRREQGDLFGLSSSINNLGLYESELSGTEETAYMQEALRIAQILGDNAGISWYSANVARTHITHGNLEDGQKFAHDALSIAERINSPYHIANALDAQAQLALAKQEFDKVEALCQRMHATEVGSAQDFIEVIELEILAALGRDNVTRAQERWLALRNFPVPSTSQLVASPLRLRALILAGQENFERAAEVLGLARAHLLHTGIRALKLPVYTRYEGQIAAALGEAAFAEARARGAALDPSETYREEIGGQS